MAIFGFVGLAAAFVLTLEKFHLLANPDAVLSCSFNLVLNCSTVMQTWQSSVFGFPNMLIGLMGYPVVITVAIAGICGVKFPRRFLIAANLVYLLGALFAYWLFFQSLYVIQVLCPWCLIVTFSTTLLFASMTHITLKDNVFLLPKSLNRQVQSFLSKDYHKIIVAVWIVFLTALVFVKFGDALFA